MIRMQKIIVYAQHFIINKVFVFRLKQFSDAICVPVSC